MSAASDNELAQLRRENARLKETHKNQCESIAKLEDVHDVLRTRMDELTSPAFVQAKFLGVVTSPQGPRAEVFLDGRRRVVGTVKSVGLSTMKLGDVVSLSQNLNLIVGCYSSAELPDGEIAIVEQLLDPTRLIVSARGEQLCVHVGAALRGRTLAPGSSVLIQRSLLLATEKVEQPQTSKYRVEFPVGLTRESFCGQKETLERILTAAATIMRPELAEAYAFGNSSCLILHGPPGNGKSLLAQITAYETRRPFYLVNGAAFQDPYLGVTHKNIFDCCDIVSATEGVLFLDEIDSIAGRRGGGVGGSYRQVQDTYLGSLLTGLDSFNKSSGKKVLVLMATNRLDILDSALVSRSQTIFVGPPDRAASEAILKIHLPAGIRYHPNSAAADNTRQEMVGAVLSTFFTPNACEVAAAHFRDGSRRAISASSLVSGRMLKQICQDAKSSAIARELRKDSTCGLRVADVEDAAFSALKGLVNLLTPRNLKDYVTALPQDLEVVRVESLMPRGRAGRLFNRSES